MTFPVRKRPYQLQNSLTLGLIIVDSTQKQMTLPTLPWGWSLSSRSSFHFPSSVEDKYWFRDPISASDRLPPVIKTMQKCINAKKKKKFFFLFLFLLLPLLFLPLSFSGTYPTFVVIWREILQMFPYIAAVLCYILPFLLFLLLSLPFLPFFLLFILLFLPFLLFPFLPLPLPLLHNGPK